MDIDINQIIYLSDILKKEDAKVASVKYREKLKLDREKREKQLVQDDIYRNKKNLAIKEWENWYNKTIQVTLEPRVFKTELSAKKARKRDIGKMKKMWFFRYIFDNFHSLSQFSNLSDNVLIHLYRVKLEEDKATQQTQELEKVRKYIEKEKQLEEECAKYHLAYVKYNKLPGKKWKNSKKWNEWLEIDNERKKKTYG